VTAVQVARVTQPARWQRDFADFDRLQHGLLPEHAR
jgi:formate dehydrogenase major subunit